MRLRYAASTSWIALSALLFSLNASASVEQQLSQCAAKQDKLERLICYDNLAAKVKNKSQAAHHAPVAKADPANKAKPAPQAAAVASQASNVEESFGKVYKEPKVELNKISLKVKSVKKSPHGTLTIYFDNGQVWKQSDAQRYKVKAGETVYIEKAALGSFLMGKAGTNKTIRVKRLD